MFRILEAMGRVRAIVVNARRNYAEVDQLRVQLAACGVAALGAIQPDHLVRRGTFGWSASYQDVVDTRRQLDDFREIVLEVAKQWSRCDCLILPTSHPDYKPCVHERAHLAIIKPRGAH